MNERRRGNVIVYHILIENRPPGMLAAWTRCPMVYLPDSPAASGRRGPVRGFR